EGSGPARRTTPPAPPPKGAEPASGTGSLAPEGAEPGPGKGSVPSKGPADAPLVPELELEREPQPED
ncbi:MAG: hypothetical protein KDK70_35490, partial [Myxococcales bacterium]|nr:hypothetical protein [Myxococcales bacterium]